MERQITEQNTKASSGKAYLIDQIRLIFSSQQTTLGFLKLDYKLTVFRFYRRLAMFWSWLRRKHITTIFVFLFLLFISLFFSYYVTYYSGIDFTDKDTMSNYFSTVGAMIGGIIAVVFTLSIFVVQNARKIMPAYYLEIYVHNWAEKLIFIITSALAILFLGISISTFQSNRIVIFFSVLSTILVFILLGYWYRHIRKKVIPERALVFIAKNSAKLIKAMGAKAKKIAEIIELQNQDNNKEYALPTAYNSFFQGYLSYVDRDIESLFSIATKLSDENMEASSKNAISAAVVIINSYLDIRKNSSLSLPVPEYLFMAHRSDLHNFLSASLERLRTIGEKFIRENKDASSVFVADCFYSLLFQAKEIKFIGSGKIGQSENSVFDLIKGYFSGYIDFSIKNKNDEVILQSARILQKISSIVVEKDYYTSIMSVQEKLRDIALYAIGNNRSFIIDECNVAWINILKSIFYYKSEMIGRYQIDDTFKNINEFAILNYVLLKNPLAFNLRNPYDSLFSDFFAPVINQISKLKDQKDKDFYVSMLMLAFEELQRSLRTTSEQIKDCNNIVVDDVARLIQNLCEAMIRLLSWDEFKDEKSELINKLSWYIHLPYWFVHHAQEIETGNGFRELVQAVIQPALFLFLLDQKDQDKLLAECVNSLFSIVKQLFKRNKDASGYDEPRTMVEICYIGILALKHNKKELFVNIKSKIEEFQILFEKKYFEEYKLKLPPGIVLEQIYGHPSRDQLKKELLSWKDDIARDRYPGRAAIFDDSDHIMQDLVSEYDIDRFIFNVWGVMLEYSEFGKRVELICVLHRIIDKKNVKFKPLKGKSKKLSKTVKNKPSKRYLKKGKQRQ